MNKSLFLYCLTEAAQESSDGGLFDFNATLPLMILQFLLFMFILNTIFYSPVGKILDERDEQIKIMLTTASNNLKEANSLTASYESELASARKKAQSKINNAKKDAQASVSKQLVGAQKEAEALIASASKQLDTEKEQALASLESQVDKLSDQIKSKLLII